MAGRGRDDAAIAEALGMLAGVLGGNPNVVGMGAARQLSEFQKNNPPMFKGAYDPDGAQKWLKEIERIFRVTECADNQKVRFGTHMLSEEADDWWVATRTELETAGNAEITWGVFRQRFLRKYFPEDVRGKKEIEFLELRQGNVERVYLWQIFLYRIHRDWVILPPFYNSNVISLESNRVVLFGKISC
ncbi:hypothetical protein KIW84_062643 [Lathyrus oleraceus]|uniref:Retrotransposon gag domain-containing protein n=1 Tax=Pisum sativum TaxID=3888 RepID=A0A9D5A5U0_PEA|nr:hypothetical protein KIW84_062643 [Pisum sativum]